MAKKLVTSSCLLWPDVFHHLFKLWCVLLANRIPLLRGSEMDIVDAVKVDVLQMPSECAFPHSEI